MIIYSCLCVPSINFTVVNYCLQEPFQQTMHTIDFVDAASGHKCASTTVKVPSYHGSKCISTFEFPSSSCATSSELNVTAFTNNSFGAGQTSHPITTCM